MEINIIIINYKNHYIFLFHLFCCPRARPSCSLFYYIFYIMYRIAHCALRSICTTYCYGWKKPHGDSFACGTHILYNMYGEIRACQNFRPLQGPCSQSPLETGELSKHASLRLQVRDCKSLGALNLEAPKFKFNL